MLEEFYADLTPGGAQLADAFGFGRDDSRLEDLVLDLHAKIQSHAYPELWLAEQRESWAGLPEDVGETAYGRELLAAVARKARHWAAILEEGLDRMAGDEAVEKAYGPAFQQGAGMLRELAEAVEIGWDRAGAVPPGLAPAGGGAEVPVPGAEGPAEKPVGPVQEGDGRRPVYPGRVRRRGGGGQ